MNIVITEKKEKLCQINRDTRVPQKVFPDKVTPDLDGFTDETVV